MVTDQVMDMIRLEINKAEKLKEDLVNHNQPKALISKQQGVIDGLQLAEELLGNYEEQS